MDYRVESIADTSNEVTRVNKINDANISAGPDVHRNTLRVLPVHEFDKCTGLRSDSSLCPSYAEWRKYDDNEKK